MSNDAVSQAIAPNVIIEGADGATGAQAVAPEARGRDFAPQATQYVPTGALFDPALQHELEALLYRQAALLDAKDWQGWMETFTDDGIYWMPVAPHQTGWESEPSIFAEDRSMMEIRKRRLEHPNAWSQAPMWGTNHMIGNVLIEAVNGDEVSLYSRFQMMELRRDNVRHFGGTYRHTLLRTDAGWKVRLLRVDMMNGQATYDYVLQAWV